MGKEILVFNIDGEIFLLQGEALNRNQKIEIESIVEGGLDDNFDMLEGKDNYELLDWIVSEVKKNTGVELTSVGIGAEFKINKPY